MIKFSYDKAGDILEIRFSDAVISSSEYVEEAGLVIDYDGHGNIVGLEIIAFSKKVGKNHELEAMAV